jgi:hypothetical protein
MLRRLSFLPVLFAVTLAVGCGGATSTTPTAPATPSSAPSAGNPPSGGGGGAAITVAGFVPGAVALTGACPAIRFAVESKQTGAYIDTVITTDASTQFSGGVCGDVQLGVLLEVQGQQQPDKSLIATLVKFTPKGVPIRLPR